MELFSILPFTCQLMVTWKFAVLLQTEMFHVLLVTMFLIGFNKFS